jgi:thioredoxin reductase (NADPH)
MSKPIILSVDDDAKVLQAISRDLRSQYGVRFRIVQAESGPSALEAVRKLKLRGESLALFLVDERMPKMSGVEFLEHSLNSCPNARRVLLTAYADTDAIIRAVNQAKIHHYLTKPWNPPEQKLYPALNDLLDDWESSYLPPFEGLRLIGHRWSLGSHQLKDFLARNHVPYRWLNLEVNTEAEQILKEANLDAPDLPVVIFDDGTYLCNPTTVEVAERVGLKTQPQRRFYDLAIIGGGPAGLAAAVYSSSEGLRTVLIERQAPGGQAGTSSRIENYLGFPSGLSGDELARRATVQASRLGAEIIAPQEAVAIRSKGPYHIVTLRDGSELSCHALLIATGVSYKILNLPGVEHLNGSGIYYGAAMTEALACRGENVFVIGAGNSAGQAALHLANYARKVVILVRGKSLRDSMSHYLVDQIEDNSVIQSLLNCQIIGAYGQEHLESLTYKNSKTGQTATVQADAMFIFIGAKPHTQWLAGYLEMDENGYILSGPDLKRSGCQPRNWPLEREPFLLETNIPGIFAIGDARYQSVKRVASAVGEGAIAVQFAHRYLANL